MILNTQLSHDAEYIGNVKENRVGIDKNNIDFITTLLTSNLYSKPLESFLRETVANAYDSHIEAGTEEYILLLIEEISYKTYRISIRDYGTGVSPERFDAIYKNIGSSTKRESNDFIGMFGIGRFSCLSCADVANVTSYYQGKKYSYVMYKNGGGINIDQISVIEGDYKSGLEVSIEYTTYDIMSFIKAIKRLSMFEKLHISYKEGDSGYCGDNYRLKKTVDDFNSRIVTHFKTFSVCSLIDYPCYKVGNVLYECENLKIATRGGIAIDLPMGSVDITPNREALQYTDFTNTTISKQIAVVKQEFKEMVKASVNRDMSLQEFCNEIVFKRSYEIQFVKNNLNYMLRISPEDVEIESNWITIEGEAIPENYAEYLLNIRYNDINKSIVHKILNNSGYRRINANIGKILKGDILLIDKKDKVTKQVTLDYVSDNLNSTAIILTCNGLEALKHTVETNSSYPNTGFNSKDCTDFTFKHLPIISMSNDSVPDSYKEKYKENKVTKKRIEDDRISIRLYHENGYRISTLDNLPREGLIVYTVHTFEDDSLRGLSSICYHISGLAAVITVKAEHAKLLEHNKRFITAEKFMYERNSMLNKIATALVIYDNFEKIKSGDLFNLRDLPIFREFASKYQEQLSYIRYNPSNSTKTFIRDYYKSKGWINKYDIKYFSLTEEEVDSYLKWKKLESNKYDIIRRIAYRKFGRIPKIGLVPLAISKT